MTSCLGLHAVSCIHLATVRSLRPIFPLTAVGGRGHMSQGQQAGLVVGSTGSPI